MSFFARVLGSPAPSTETKAAREKLEAILRDGLPDAHEEAVRITTAVVGLFACVAYADRVYSPEEEAKAREQLSAIRHLQPRAVEAALGLLREHGSELARLDSTTHTRVLRDLGTRELRTELLEVLLGIAAADGRLTLDETNTLRELATALGLTQADYNALQAKHRDKLSVLG